MHQAHHILCLPHEEAGSRSDCSHLCRAASFPRPLLVLEHFLADDQRLKAESGYSQQFSALCNQGAHNYAALFVAQYTRKEDNNLTSE